MINFEHIRLNDPNRLKTELTREAEQSDITKQVVDYLAAQSAAALLAELKNLLPGLEQAAQAAQRDLTEKSQALAERQAVVKATEKQLERLRQRTPQPAGRSLAFEESGMQTGAAFQRGRVDPRDQKKNDTELKQAKHAADQAQIACNFATHAAKDCQNDLTTARRIIEVLTILPEVKKPTL